MIVSNTLEWLLDSEALSRRLELMDPQIYVAMTSNVSIEAKLLDVTAAFKAIGRSEDVVALGT
jgi:hypothetical protein